MWNQPVQRVIEGDIPSGRDFEACRAVLRGDCDDTTAFHALCTLLEGALAHPQFGVDETEPLVPLIKALARNEVRAKDLL
jgi:hypothetical protein